VVVSSDRYLQLADIAATQWGMLTTAQARQADISAQQLARLANSGVLRRLQHGVYLLAGVPHDPLAELKAAWLGLDPEATAADRLARPDPGGIVSYRSAAKVHRLGDLDADLSEFTVTTPRRTRHRDIRLYKRTLARADWEIVDGLPTTTVAATVRDLASTTIDGGHLAGVVRDALLHGQLTYDDTAATLRPYAHHYGAPLGDGRSLIRTLLSQAGLTQTTTAATELGDDWLAQQLENTGLRYRTADVLLHASRQFNVETELLAHSGIFGASPLPARPLTHDGDAAAGP
jgi:hypothetical protein